MVQGRIVRDKEPDQIYLNLLQGHFDSVEGFEKYPDAIFNLLFSEASEKILGKEFRKERISQRKAKKLNEFITKKLFNKYGKWVTFCNFKIKKDLSMSYKTNIHLIFRVKDLGILYGCEPHGITGNIFFTSHALERFEERSDKFYIEPIKEDLRGAFKTEPSSYEIIHLLIKASNQQYGILDKYCYLNILVGFLVIEDLGDTFIVKTFYSNDMKKTNIKWYQGEINIENANSLADLLHSPAKPIDEPVFIQDEVEDILEFVEENEYL